MRINEQSLLFLDENHERNDKDWFAANKARYAEYVETPMLAIAEGLGPVIADIDPSLETLPKRTLSRIWRDTRFSNDKSRFKKSVWITFRKEKGLSHPVYFFEFCSEFHRYGCGYYATPAPVMTCIRDRILAKDHRFSNAQKALVSLPHFSVEGDTYVRPKYKNQPQSLRTWLERKSVTIMHTSSERAPLFSDTLVDVLADAFRTLAPAYEFLAHCHTEALREQEYREFIQGKPL